MTNENPDRITIVIEPAVQRKYKELCEDRGSNMSVELRRFIYQELEKEGK